jgi:hypothetical protein
MQPPQRIGPDGESYDLRTNADENQCRCDAWMILEHLVYNDSLYSGWRNTHVDLHNSHSDDALATLSVGDEW